MKKLISVSLFSLLFIPLIATASIDTNLYYGLQNNSDVRELQEFLIDKGVLDNEPTGNFFSLTLNAVKAYQKKQGIIQTGYVGILTRTAINSELSTQLSGSNAEAITETGATPPAPAPQATTNDVISTLQAQIALLLQQVQAMQTQQTTTQQIVQNTTPTTTPTCTPSWQCATWSTCTNSLQTRTCADANGCGVSTGRPSQAQSCSVSCTPNWQCGSWNTCINNLQGRTCTDSNNCGTLVSKPTESQSCISPLSISKIRIVDTTTHTARFSWETNQDAYGIVILTNCTEDDLNCVNFVWGEGETQSIIYGYSAPINKEKLTDEGYFAERTNRTYTKQHQLNFTGLNLGNDYYYRIIVINEEGEIATSPNIIGNYYAKF